MLALDEEEHHLTSDPESDHEVTLNPRAAEFRPVTGMQPILSTVPITDVINTLRLPAVELVQYDGNPLKFWSFIRTFESKVENCTSDNAAKLSRLIYYCTGKVRRVIECCSVMSPEEGYPKAKALLKQRFGNDFLIAEAWVKKVTSGKPIGPQDKERLQELSDDLCSCIETLIAMNYESELRNQSILLKIAEQLPTYLQARVKRELCKVRDSGSVQI